MSDRPRGTIETHCSATLAQPRRASAARRKPARDKRRCARRWTSRCRWRPRRRATSLRRPASGPRDGGRGSRCGVCCSCGGDRDAATFAATEPISSFHRRQRPRWRSCAPPRERFSGTHATLAASWAGAQGEGHLQRDAADGDVRPPPALRAPAVPGGWASGNARTRLRKESYGCEHERASVDDAHRCSCRTRRVMTALGCKASSKICVAARPASKPVAPQSASVSTAER